MLEPWLQQRLGLAVHRLEPVAGGSIHRCWRLDLIDGSRAFLKTNRHAALPWLEAEVEGLEALAAVAPATLSLPKPLACERVGDQAVLLLNWLEFSAKDDSAAWHRFGLDLASLHKASVAAGAGQGCFGWRRDNVIGAMPQPNGWSDDWAGFFVEQRLAHQLRLASASGLEFRGAVPLLARARALLQGHQPEPALVHGDLWRGNADLLVVGGAALYDPAVHRADREVDLAMTQLFGGFPAPFFAGYHQGWPLPPDADERVELYNLYHRLNHANLFGGGYVRQAQQVIDALLR
jgi:fructosamine-3-kinase